jgi:hypothetical protein
MLPLDLRMLVTSAKTFLKPHAFRVGYPFAGR